jgi:hypothetical protein
MSARITTAAVMITLTALAAACDQPLPTAAVDQDLASMDLVAAGHAQAGDEVPLRMTADGTFIGQDLAPGFGPPTLGRSTFDGRCTVPSDFVVRFSLSGRATHHGRFTASVEHCTQLDFQTGLSTITDGSITYRAANGDVLRSRHQGASENPAVGTGSVSHHEYVGGTGRFAGASGEATSHTACNRSTGTCVFSLQGTLRYDASDRSR